MKLARSACLALGALLLGSLTGCVTPSMVANRIVKAPNRLGLPKPLKTLAQFGEHSLPTWKVSVGPPSASLAVSVLEPGDYKMSYELKDKQEGDRRTLAVKFNASLPGREQLAERAKATPKGTLVLLHGIMMSKESVLVPWGIFFAQQGYRVVLVDLRGHGGSTGNWIGFGAWEGDDLVKVADDLDRRGLLKGPVGVFGISYGAAMAIHWAARDVRVGAIVALAPYSDARRAVVEFARGAQPKLAARISDATFAEAEERATRLAGFSWEETDVQRALKRTHAPVLFLHGKWDDWVPPAHSEQLERLAPLGSRRETSDDNHWSLTVRLDPIGAKAVAWFEAQLKAADATLAARP